MRKIRDVLRLTFGKGLSRRPASAPLGIPSAPSPPTAPSRVIRPQPDWSYVHTEQRKQSVTLQLLWLEYRAAHPDGNGYGYSQLGFSTG
jgi:transposase